MLKIWYEGIELDDKLEVLEKAPAYFDNVWEEEWLEDPLVKEMILDVDKSKVIGPHLIESPVLVPIAPTGISGGVKLLILLLKDNSFIYDLSSCGNNCAKWILKIAEKKDLECYLGYMMNFRGDFEIEILNTNKIVRNHREYIFEISAIDDRFNVGELKYPDWI